jgi:hypothetical protein
MWQDQGTWMYKAARHAGSAQEWELKKQLYAALADRLSAEADVRPQSRTDNSFAGAAVQRDQMITQL